MKNILNSATRLVLISLVVTLNLCVVLVVFRNADKSEVVTGIMGIFSMVLSAAVAFYYKSSSSNSQNEGIVKSVQTTEKTTSSNTQETQSEA